MAFQKLSKQWRQEHPGGEENCVTVYGESSVWIRCDSPLTTWYTHIYTHTERHTQAHTLPHTHTHTETHTHRDTYTSTYTHYPHTGTHLKSFVKAAFLYNFSILKFSRRIIFVHLLNKRRFGFIFTQFTFSARICAKIYKIYKEDTFSSLEIIRNICFTFFIHVFLHTRVVLHVIPHCVIILRGYFSTVTRAGIQ